MVGCDYSKKRFFFFIKIIYIYNIKINTFPPVNKELKTIITIYVFVIRVYLFKF